MLRKPRKRQKKNRQRERERERERGVGGGDEEEYTKKRKDISVSGGDRRTYTHILLDRTNLLASALSFVWNADLEKQKKSNKSLVQNKTIFTPQTALAEQPWVWKFKHLCTVRICYSVGLWFSKIYHYNRCIISSDAHSLRSNREHLLPAWAYPWKIYKIPDSMGCRVVFEHFSL